MLAPAGPGDWAPSEVRVGASVDLLRVSGTGLSCIDWWLPAGVDKLLPDAVGILEGDVVADVGVDDQGETAEVDHQLNLHDFDKAAHSVVVKPPHTP
ncbi:hypothetical protein V5R04_07670 [Jonesiaceae bacterium BS-20]|uniref:Uncharacterized protein n=1 Tax=Jonesiaceae bacterium BS-20 TaxID=3120821 RepID=A0AAU7E0X5_9MICO